MMYEKNMRSARLLMRPVALADKEAWTKFFVNEEGNEFIPDFGLSNPSEKASLWITKQMERYEKKQFGLLAMIEKNSEHLVGMCGLLTQEVDHKTELEIGYHILKRYRGMGYATEAARYFKKYAFDRDLAPSLVSIIHIGNKYSVNVALRINMSFEKQTRWRDKDVFLFRVKK